MDSEQLNKNNPGHSALCTACKEQNAPGCRYKQVENKKTVRSESHCFYI